MQRGDQRDGAYKLRIDAQYWCGNRRNAQCFFLDRSGPTSGTHLADLACQLGVVNHGMGRDGRQFEGQLLHPQLLGKGQRHLALGVAMQLQFSARAHADFEGWIDELAQLDRQARSQDAYVIPSLILSDLEQCANFAQQVEQAGLRVLELNIGAPHDEEAAKGAIVL